MTLIVGVAESLIKEFRGRPSPKVRQKPTTRPVVVPYVHALSLEVKRVAYKYNLPVVFSAPQKLSRLCSALKQGSTSDFHCDVNSRTPFVSCALGVVYQIPFTSG